jgi:molybdate transport system substrate-binding protein
MERRAADDDGARQRRTLPQPETEHGQLIRAAAGVGMPTGCAGRSQAAARPFVPLASLLACFVLGLSAIAPRAQAEDVLVFAAASLKPALDTLLGGPHADAVDRIQVSYAASSQLARQIEHGAPAGVFISADPEWMDHLQARGLILADTRSNLLGNALVLIAPRASEVELRIEPGFDLIGALGAGGRLAVAEPDSVPAGRYAKSALSRLGVWSAVAERIVPAANVRAALNFVVRNETPLGIVYRSDAVSENRVRVVDRFPAATHPPIIYPVAIVAGADSESARRLLERLHADDAGVIFTRFGFDRLPP